MKQLTISCSCDPATWILTPSMNIGQNVINAIINILDDGLGGKTGTLSFSGVVKAFLTLDDSGRVIGYTLTEHNASTQQSVENILARI